MRRVPRWQSGAVSNELRERAARSPAGGSQRRFPDDRPRERLRVQDFQDSPRPLFRRRIELTGRDPVCLVISTRHVDRLVGEPIFTKRVRLKVVDRWPATTVERNDATSYRSSGSTIARSERRWVIPGAADRGHSARMRALVLGTLGGISRCCLSLFVIVRTGRPVPRQEIVKVMYGHVARYVHLERVYLERIFMPLARSWYYENRSSPPADSSNFSSSRWYTCVYSTRTRVLLWIFLFCLSIGSARNTRDMQRYVNERLHDWMKWVLLIIFGDDVNRLFTFDIVCKWFYKDFDYPLFTFFTRKIDYLLPYVTFLDNYSFVGL